jgi:hypothetical protein
MKRVYKPEAEQASRGNSLTLTVHLRSIRVATGSSEAQAYECVVTNRDGDGESLVVTDTKIETGTVAVAYF